MPSPVIGTEDPRMAKNAPALKELWLSGVHGPKGETLTCEKVRAKDGGGRALRGISLTSKHMWAPGFLEGMTFKLSLEL